MLLRTAKIVLGLKEYEEFEVVQCNVTRVFRFTNNALEWWNGTSWVEDRDVLYEILNRECEIKFKDFLPLEHEEYFTIDDVHISDSRTEVDIHKCTWTGSVTDYLRYTKGLVFNNYAKAWTRLKEVKEWLQLKQ